MFISSRSLNYYMANTIWIYLIITAFSFSSLLLDFLLFGHTCISWTVSQYLGFSDIIVMEPLLLIFWLTNRFIMLATYICFGLFLCRLGISWIMTFLFEPIGLYWPCMLIFTGAQLIGRFYWSIIFEALTSTMVHSSLKPLLYFR